MTFNKPSSGFEVASCLLDTCEEVEYVSLGQPAAGIEIRITRPPSSVLPTSNKN
jgi:hypothetical protein